MLKRHTITLAKPDHQYGYRKGQWFYAYNVLVELDRPGEWYLDRELGLLFFWPPTELRDRSVTVSLLPELVHVTDSAFVTSRPWWNGARRRCMPSRPAPPARQFDRHSNFPRLPGHSLTGYLP